LFETHELVELDIRLNIELSRKTPNNINEYSNVLSSDLEVVKSSSTILPVISGTELSRAVARTITKVVKINLPI
jgi:hypothetical protein